MAFKNLFITLTCAAAFPALASAQSPAWTMAGTAGCCETTTDDGSAQAAAVLLPPALALPPDVGADALAASVLLPGQAGIPAAGCCGALATASAPVDHSAHMGMQAAIPDAPATHASGDMACCNHDEKPVAAKAEGACCHNMKDADGCKDCGMPCCQSLPPSR